MLIMREGRPVKNTGYTLVELMIVVVVIAIGGTIAAASIMEAQKNSMLTDVVRETYNLLETARSRALMRNVAMGVIINNANPSSTLISLNESWDTSCNMISGVGAAPPDPVLMGLEIVNLAESRWQKASGSNIVTSGLTVNGGAAGSGATLCINRRGRILMLSGGNWTNVTGTPAFEIRFQRQDSGMAVGVERIVRMEQGGIARIVR
jgi:prepilin-type N-terminal cleavage/methylation domain-containing protein